MKSKKMIKFSKIKDNYKYNMTNKLSYMMIYKIKNLNQSYSQIFN